MGDRCIFLYSLLTSFCCPHNGEVRACVTGDCVRRDLRRVVQVPISSELADCTICKNK